MKKATFLLVAILILPFILFAQKRPKNKMKFGKIAKEEFENNFTLLDTTANAIILGDYHYYSLDAINNSLKTSINVHRRILIIDPENAKDLANLSISLFQGTNGQDKLSKFKAATYNLENGEILETKLNKDSKFKEENDNWNTYKFAFNNVKENSIIEYTYTISSDFFEFPTYYPQQEYPVLWSELVLQYIDGINFKFSYTGNTSPLFRNSETNVGKVSDTWVFKDVAPLKQDIFMGPVRNYQTNINYELRTIEIPGFLYREYTTSWQEIASDYLENEHRGNLIKKGRYFKDIVDHVNANANTDMEKVTAALSYIRTNYLWNGKNSDYPSWNFNDVVKDKKGNSADLNILLMGALTSLEITTNPVLLSTRDNGWILKSNPSSEDLNYVITSFKIAEDRHFVDAATTYSGIDALPAKCLNGEALIAGTKHSAWIELSPMMKYSKRVYVQSELTEDLEIKGVCQIKEKDYAAQYIRREIKKEGSINEYIENQKDKFEDIDVSEYEVTNVQLSSQPVNVKFQFSSENMVHELGDLIAISPIFLKDFDENPFKKDHREFPIDFTYPIKLEYTYIFTIPEGFEFNELPKPTRVSNADNTMSFFLNCSSNGQTVNIALKFEIKNSMYIASSYDDIKTFFDYFISQQDQPILIKQL